MLEGGAGTFRSRFCSGSLPVQYAPQLVPHVDHHHLLPGGGQVGDLALDGLGHAGVDGAAEPAVGGDADDQVLGGLVLGGLDVGLLVQSWKQRKTTGREKTPAKNLDSTRGLDGVPRAPVP